MDGRHSDFFILNPNASETLLITSFTKCVPLSDLIRDGMPYVWTKWLHRHFATEIASAFFYRINFWPF